MSQNQISLNDLSFIYPKHSIKVGRFIIPILVDIKNIYTNFTDNELDIDIDTKYMMFEYEKLRLIKRYEYHLIHINVNDKLYDNFTKTFLEQHKINEIADLLYILNEFELNELDNHISKIISAMINLYQHRLYSALKLDQKAPEVGYKPEKEMPKNIQEYIRFPQLYIALQSSIEFNATPIFPENQGKTMAEWSYRETELHLAYLTSKNSFESIENQYHMKQQQDALKSK